MCMDEFVKRLYDFMSIYRIFWSQNSHYRYFTDIYRYLSIFYRYFFRNFSTSARAPQSRFFGGKLVFANFSAKNRRFYRFSSAFSSRCRPKTDFSAIYRPKKTIFCSLGETKLPIKRLM